MDIKMNIMEAILTRGSIRKYTDQPLTEDEEKLLLTAGFCAPSAANRRPWEFLYISDKNALNDIAENGQFTKMMKQAAACIIVCGNTERLQVHDLLLNDCSAAIENILLAAHGIGLGAVWCGIYEGQEFYTYIKDRFQIPEHIVPTGLIAVGHPAETKVQPDRYEENKVHHDIW